MRIIYCNLLVFIQLEYEYGWGDFQVSCSKRKEDYTMNTFVVLVSLLAFAELARREWRPVFAATIAGAIFILFSGPK